MTHAVRTRAPAHWGARRRPRRPRAERRTPNAERRAPNAERRTAAEPLRRVRDRSSPPLKCR
ncbi:hypothetical protein D0U02_10980 [Burkholderia pseudomallei]|nr:hypothetical protein EXY72_01510 [Burkholderia pseudomallei]RFS53482.1 hypothetical protein D0U05_18965 [Burkholderia pseudomallei]RFS64120.1 hypothetical protein D0U02_10980 [Burkholderia pseudomallei]RFS67876.1 hypothetical protein D0U01_12090 [Burkholderia pseudomallei]RFS72294.1 hypothetical protein D0T98_22565 [Burkholderia pseudomallei]